LEKNRAKSGAVRFLSSSLFKVIVSAGLLLYIFYKFNFRIIVSNMMSADPVFFVYAVLIFIASGVLGAVQWGLILRFHDIRLGFAGTVARYFMGIFFNFILPGFVGGDVVRIYKTSIVSGRPTQAFSSILADRVVGLLVLVLFSFGAFFFIPDGPARKALPVAIIMFLILFGFICLFVFKPLGRLLRSVFRRIIPLEIIEKLRTVYLEMHALTRSPRTLFSVILISFFIQFTRIAVHYVCGMAVGINLGFNYYALFVPLMAIMASLPISVGGFGVREASAVVLFSSLGLEEEIVLSYAFLTAFTSFIGAIPGGIAFVLSVNDSRKFGR